MCVCWMCDIIEHECVRTGDLLIKDNKVFSHNEKIKTCKNILICNPNYTYTRIQDISMSFFETTAKITTREKNTVCTDFSLQWVASWRVPENTKANHQQTEKKRFVFNPAQQSIKKYLRYKTRTDDSLY